MQDEVLTAHIVRMLGGGPRSSADLARRMGVPAEDLVVVLDSLVDEGLLRGRDPYELSDAGRARAQWSTQLLLGGPVDPTGHLDAAEQSRAREQEEERRQEEARRLARARRRLRKAAKSRWAAVREEQRQNTINSQTQQMHELDARSPVLAGTFRWWIEVVVQGLAGCCALVGTLVLLIFEDHPDKVLHATFAMIVGGALLFRATRAHFGSP